MAGAVTEELLTAILETIDEGIHVVNAEGVTIFYNPIAAKHDELKKEEVIGRPLLEVFPSLNKETSTLLKVIESGKPIFHQQQAYTNIKGTQLVTVNTTLPIWVKGTLVGAVEIAKDITRIKELSEKHVDLQARITSMARGDRKEKKALKSKAYYQLHDIITANAEMKLLKERATKAARTASPILVSGETGTGKELFVQAIHHQSPRKQGPFIAQNCAALPDTLLESILFGTVKGSFTGAENRAGLFELADGGTLFLDEINSMPADLQAKLLRVLQEGMVRRIGGTEVIPVDVRVIAAMNVSPEEALQNGELRSDLYYRIKVIHFEIPPLRNRKEDIPLLVHHFIQKFNFRFSTLVTTIADDVMERFMEYAWPGNVRELEHVIESAMNWVEDDCLAAEHFPEEIMEKWPKTKRFGPANNNSSLNLREILKDTEVRLIEEALQRTEGNIQQAAQVLGIPRQTLQYKMLKYKMLKYAIYPSAE